MANSVLTKIVPAGPATSAAAVTPSNSVDLTAPTRALYVGGTGDVKVDMVDGQTVVFATVPVGWMPICATRVYATGTSATNILAVW